MGPLVEVMASLLRVCLPNNKHRDLQKRTWLLGTFAGVRIESEVGAGTEEAGLIVDGSHHACPLNVATEVFFL